MIETLSIPYIFHSEGDNVGQVDIELSLKPYDGDFGEKNVLLIDICVRHLQNVKCHLSYRKQFLNGIRFLISDHKSIIYNSFFFDV